MLSSRYKIKNIRPIFDAVECITGQMRDLAESLIEFYPIAQRCMNQYSVITGQPEINKWLYKKLNPDLPDKPVVGEEEEHYEFRERDMLKKEKKKKKEIDEMSSYSMKESEWLRKHVGKYWNYFRKLMTKIKLLIDKCKPIGRKTAMSISKYKNEDNTDELFFNTDDDLLLRFSETVVNFNESINEIKTTNKNCCKTAQDLYTTFRNAEKDLSERKRKNGKVSNGMKRRKSEKQTLIDLS